MAWTAWSRQHRPYGLVAEKAREAWANVGREDDLDEVMRRLDRLDPAFAIEVHRLEGMLRNPSEQAELHRTILDLEADQQKQRSAMQVTVDRLTAEGLPVPPLGCNPARRIRRARSMDATQRRPPADAVAGGP